MEIKNLSLLPDHLQKEFTLIAEHAQALLTEDGELAPVALLSSKDARFIVKLNFDSPERKELEIRTLKHIIEKENVDTAFIVTETWVLKKREAADYSRKHGTISTHPEKEEAIMFNIECKEGVYMALGTIQSNQNKPEMPLIELMEADDNEGRLSRLIKRAVH